jgi:hypothetical protein
MPGLVRRRAFRCAAGAAAVLLTVAVTGWQSPARASSAYPNPGCTIPPKDYYDFYDDCAAYTNWGKYFPDGAISSGPWFVDLPTALGDTISALSYDGKTYIQGIAHGTEMGFNFHEGSTDCYNPTEPGGWDDDITAKWGAGWNAYPWLGPSTTKVLAAPSYPSATSVTTQTQLAMWLSNGEKDGYCTGGASYPGALPYTNDLSPYVLTKTVSVGPLPELPSLPDVMKIDASLNVASTPGATSTDGVFITFLRCNFTSWWELPAGSNTFVGGLGPGNPPADTTLQSGQNPVSGQDMDVLVAATPDGSQAFALYSPAALNSAAPYGETQFAWLQDSPAGCGYGKQLSDQITFYGAKTAKRAAGTYHYRVYAAFGTLEQVKAAVLTMRNDAALGPTHVRPLGPSLLPRPTVIYRTG